MRTALARSTAGLPQASWHQLQNFDQPWPPADLEGEPPSRDLARSRDLKLGAGREEDREATRRGGVVPCGRAVLCEMRPRKAECCVVGIANVRRHSILMIT